MVLEIMTEIMAKLKFTGSKMCDAKDGTNEPRSSLHIRVSNTSLPSSHFLDSVQLLDDAFYSLNFLPLSLLMLCEKNGGTSSNIEQNASMKLS